MFIVKHIGPSGAEKLHQTPTIRYSPGLAPIDAGYVSPAPATVWVRDKADEPEFPLTGGTVFVMNDNGKTVARYNLVAPDYRDPEQPSFAEFSREKDGGLAAEAVDTLRGRVEQHQPGPNSRVLLDEVGMAAAFEAAR